MEVVDGFDVAPPFQVVEPPDQRLPFVFNSPHSGRLYPKAFLAASRLDETAIRRSEDTYVDELFRPAVALGAPLLHAHFPRSWLDVNREPYELDPAMFAGKLPAYANIRSIRVAGGLGTIARIVSDSEEIYAAPLAVDDALNRIDLVYAPYHQTLRRLLARTHVRFGFAVLIDCHSMPSTVRGGHPRGRPDFVVGDRYGASCAPGLTETAIAALTDLGYSVSRNKPYAGGFITEHYGRPARRLHALQIEVNRALYLNETTLAKSSGFSRLMLDLGSFVGTLARRSDLDLAAAPREAAE
jgi:N-formylglutamate amidohydrolase